MMMDTSREPSETESTLEFILNTLCRALNMKPKQSAALLTNNNQFLTHCVVKGVKSRYEPMINWYKEVYQFSRHLSMMLEIEVENAKTQAEQVKNESKIQYRKADIEFEIKKLEVEARTKRELMQFEYELNVGLKELELQAQKELVEAQNQTQREIANTKMSVSSIAGPPDTGKPAKSFESKGNDVLGGIDLSRFEPR